MKTVNLELSKQLKEAGYPQKGWYAYLNNNLVSNAFKHSVWEDKDWCISPTADEMLENLPHQLEDSMESPWLICTRNKADEWIVGYAIKEKFEIKKTDISLSDAAAKMWLYLNSLKEKSE